MENSLPTKTKIAAWWMIVIGIIAIAGGLIGFIPTNEGIAIGFFSQFFTSLFFIGFLIFWVSSSIFKKNRTAWWIAIFLLFVVAVLAIIAGWIWAQWSLSFGNISLSLVSSTPFLIPLFLLLFDRKNFFKIAK